MRTATDHIVNQQIINGSFPKSKLIPLDLSWPPALNAEILAKKGIKQIENHVDSLPLILSVYSKRCQELDMLNKPELYEQDINYWINLGLYSNCMNDDTKTTNEAIALCPVVTKIDTILWYGAYMTSISDTIGFSDDDNDFFQTSLAWSYILVSLQRKQLETGHTIKIEALSSKETIISILEGDWENVEKRHFVELTSSEHLELQRLFENRRRILNSYQNERGESSILAKQSLDSWNKYIYLLNDLSEREHNTIRLINSDFLTRNQKIQAINEYTDTISSIERGEYCIDNKRISLVPLFHQVFQRIKQACDYVCVSDDRNNPFRISGLAIVLAMEPKRTFNYLYISFHQFRLAQTIENAKAFADLALQSIASNLNCEVDSVSSMDRTVETFCSLVSAFVAHNRQAIDNLSFQTLQVDSIAIVPESAILPYETDMLHRLWYNSAVDQIAGLSETEIERKIIANNKLHSKKEILDDFQEGENASLKVKKAALARQIVVSINIIYMMREMLRMIRGNKQLLAVLRMSDSVDKYRRELQRIDESLLHIVYSKIDESSCGMMEYREDQGFDTKTLSEQENREGQERDIQFFDTLKDAIGSITQGIDNLNIKQLMQTKTLIREQIFGCPDSIAKEHLAGWIDEVVADLCKALVTCCEDKTDEFDEARGKLSCLLGEHSKRLPPSAFATLATAEILYNRYAIKEYAEEGFDYSSISALYYQAFEEAYNEMIWKPYADWINQQLDETADDPSIINKLYWEYLPGSKENVDKYYFLKIGSQKEDPRRVVTYCVFGTFYHLLNVVNKQTTAPKFREWFSRLAGYNRVSDMLVDKEFMNILGGFKDAVNKATPNRNNASHGGSIISKEQCCQDKKTVLSEMETVRSNSLGLIQQLLFIIKGQPC